MFGFFDVIQDILSNLRTFGLRDVIDIAVVSLAMYQIFLFARKSRAGQLVRGLLLLLVFYALADVMQLRTVRWVLTNVMQIGFIAAIVLFQPELRRTLEHMGQSTNWTKLLFTTHRQDPTLRGAWQSAVVAICDAAEQLSDTRTGALMVLERMNNLDEIIRTGTPLSADVIPEMLGTIFYEGTPLHDGAVVIRDGRIVAAGIGGNGQCFFADGIKHNIHRLRAEHRQLDAHVGIIGVGDAGLQPQGGFARPHFAAENDDRASFERVYDGGRCVRQFVQRVDVDGLHDLLFGF